MSKISPIPRTSRAKRTLVTEPLPDPRPQLLGVLRSRQAILEKTAGFTVWQETLRQRLGVTPCEFLAARRVLVKGVDWGFDANNHAAFTPEAAEKMAAALRVAVPAGALVRADVPLRVTRGGPQIRNQRLLQATLGAPAAGLAIGAPVLVFVRDNRHWKAGDAITARHREGIYFDISSRTPRRRA